MQEERENKEVIYVKCECQEINNLKNILKRSGISEEYLKFNFKQFKPNSKVTTHAKNKAVDYVMKFVEIKKERSNSIAFLGKVGSGKTHLSISIANALMNQGIVVLYMQFRDAITALKQNVIDEAFYQEQIRRYKNAKVLLIDDLFKGSLRQGKVNESDVSIMFEIINHRYLNKSPIIISSEYGPEEILEFDEAVGSRILDMCKNFMVNIGEIESNYRLKDILK